MDVNSGYESRQCFHVGDLGGVLDESLVYSVLDRARSYPRRKRCFILR